MICLIWQYFFIFIFFYLCSLVLKKNNQSVNSIEVLESANIYIFFSKEIYCAYLTNFYLYKYDITLKQISNDDKDNILHQQLCWNPALFLFFACVHLIENCQLLLPESCASDHAHTSTKLLPPTTSLPFIFAFHSVFLPSAVFSLSFFSTFSRSLTSSACLPPSPSSPGERPPYLV